MHKIGIIAWLRELAGLFSSGEIGFTGYSRNNNIIIVFDFTNYFALDANF